MSKVRIKGDNKIDQWRETLNSAPELVELMSEMAAEEALSLVTEGFQKQQNPYGSPWQEKAAPDGRSILVGKTTRLRRGWHKVRGTKGRWSIQPSVVYAAAHQDPQPRARWGGKKLPQRMMIPSKSRGMPPGWSKRIEDAMGEAMSAHFGTAASGSLGTVAYRILGMKRRFNVLGLVKRAIREATA